MEGVRSVAAETLVTGWRKEFPILRSCVRGKPLVYLDNAATTQKPRTVIDAVSRFYAQDNGSVLDRAGIAIRTGHHCR